MAIYGPTGSFTTSILRCASWSVAIRPCSSYMVNQACAYRYPRAKSFSMGSAFWAARRRWCAALVSSTFFRRWSIKETRLSACSAGMTRT